MRPLTPNDRFDAITVDGLCIGCGLCQALLGSNKVRLEKSDLGELRPQLRSTLTEAEIELIYDTCPGTRCEAIPPSESETAPFHDLVWGPYHKLALAWAAEPKIRHEGSTGGVLTALARYLIHSGRVSFVLHVRASRQEPSFGEATISETMEQVLEGAGSRYGPTAPLINLSDALDREQAFAVVAKPCDLNAIRNLAHRDPRVEQYIKFMLAPVCGGYMADEAMSHFLADKGIDREQVSTLRYRGLGCPGPTTVKMSDGKSHSFHYLDFWGEDERSWSLPNRCKFCPDGIGDAADIAAADTWPDATPDRAGSAHDDGTNSVIVRTARGAELIAAACEAGFLELGKSVDPDFMNQTQPHQVKKKRFMQARYRGLKRAGRLVPDTIGLRLEELSKDNTVDENLAQEQGAFERARG